MPDRILVVDDEKNICDLWCRALRKEGLDATPAYGGEAALAALGANTYALVITDLKMPKVSGIDVLKKARSASPDTAVMIITGYGTIENAVEALREGACDYVTKPLNLVELRQKVKDILRRRRLEDEVEVLRGQLRGKDGLGGLVGASASMQKIYDLIEKMADTDCNVLIWGDSGTGKELVARAIHYGSDRKDAAFVAINCSALPESILERELFGHAKGAYTGADEGREGYFQAASGGTLFLDEITGLSPATQAKLLRTIEEKKMYRLGDPKPIDVTARILAASNVPPEDAVRSGVLRGDLYFRLNVVSIHLPPLRDKREDIPVLAVHFLRRYCNAYGRPEMSFGAEAMRALYEYDWPGNVRELENAVEKAVALSDSGTTEIVSIEMPSDAGPVIRVHDSSLKRNEDGDSGSSPNVGVNPAWDGAGGAADSAGGSYKQAKKDAVERFETDWIRRTLKETGGNVTDAAEKMDMGRTALQRLLSKYGISSKDFK